MGSHLQHAPRSDANRLTGPNPKMILVTCEIDAHPAGSEPPTVSGGRWTGQHGWVVQAIIKKRDPEGDAMALARGPGLEPVPLRSVARPVIAVRMMELSGRGGSGAERPGATAPSGGELG